MNFAEAINELDKLNEEALTEKQWVVIKPKFKPVDTTEIVDFDTRACGYRFLTVNDESQDRAAQKADIADMISQRALFPCLFAKPGWYSGDNCDTIFSRWN